MRFAIAAMLLMATAAQAEIPTPPRPVTDPKSLASPVNLESREVPLEDLSVSRDVGEAAWSADGKDVFLSINMTGRFNIWKVPAAGGWPVQITQSDDYQFNLMPSSDGRSLVFAEDRGGGEIFDLMVVPTAGGAVKNLTQTPDIAENAPLFSRDGKTLAFATRLKTAPSANIAVLNPNTGRVRQLTNESDPDFSWRPVAWSRDGKTLIANRAELLDTVSSVWAIDVLTGRATELSPKSKGGRFTASDIAADGRTVALTSNAGTGQLHAGLLDIVTGRIRWLKPTPWEQRAHDFSPDGRILRVSTNEDGRTVRILVDIATLTERPLPFPASGSYPDEEIERAFSPDSQQLLIIHTAVDTPKDIWIAGTNGKSRPLTRLAMASLNNLPKSRIVTYRSFDGTLISAIVTMPFNLKRDGSNPAIIIPHGGPTSQSRDYFIDTRTALASRGYILIAPNFRGSSGYGAAFQAGNIKDLGGGDLKDVIAAKDFLVASGYVDPKKVGITGGSYGGFMTLMALGKNPDVFAAGVQVYGVVNWQTMAAAANPQLQRYVYGLLGDPVTNKAVYDASSPLTYIRNVKVPLLSLQGENDTHVPRGQAEEVANALKANGTITETIFYPNEGHGFAKSETLADVLKRSVAWFDRYLKGAEAPTAH